MELKIDFAVNMVIIFTSFHIHSIFHVKMSQIVLNLDMQTAEVQQSPGWDSAAVDCISAPFHRDLQWLTPMEANTPRSRKQILELALHWCGHYHISSGQHYCQIDAFLILRSGGMWFGSKGGWRWGLVPITDPAHSTTWTSDRNECLGPALMLQSYLCTPSHYWWWVALLQHMKSAFITLHSPGLQSFLVPQKHFTNGLCYPP